MGTDELPYWSAVSCTVLTNSIHCVTFQPISGLPFRFGTGAEPVKGLRQVNSRTRSS
jgi:hypothetical protein